MDQKIISAIQVAKSASRFKAAVEAVPREQQYYTAQTRDLLLLKQKLITDSPTADCVTSLLYSFSIPGSMRPLLRIPEIRDLIINTLAPQITAGSPVDNFGSAVCNIVQDKPAADLYSNPESFKAILSCFHRATTAESAEWIAGSIYNILSHNPSANKILNDLPVVEAFSALLPHATNDEAVEWVSKALQKILIGNDEAQKMFRTPAFFEKFKTMEKHATSDAAKASFKSVVYQLQSIVDRRNAIEKSLRDAKNSRELTSALDFIVKQSDFWPSLVDVLLSKKHLIVASPTADSVTSFLFAFSRAESMRPVLRTPEIRDLIINTLAPKITSGSPLYHLDDAVCSIVQDKSSADLYSNPESFKAILSCFHRATTAESARWIACSINNILVYNPSANKLFNDLPVVEAFSALLPHVTSDEAIRWVSNSLQKILIGNDEAMKMFAIPAFFEQFRATEKHATSDAAKASFKSVVYQLQSIVDRRNAIEKSLRDAKNSRQLTSALDSIMKQADIWSSLVDLVVSKQHFIQDEASTSSSGKFIKWCCETNEKIIPGNQLYDFFVHAFYSPSIIINNDNFIQRREIYDLFKNVLLPNSLNFTNSVPFVHAALTLIVKNNKQAQEFFSTTALKQYIVASLPHADESVLKILNALLIGNSKAREVFGTPDFKKKIEFKFGSNVSQEFTNVIKLLNEKIIQVRFDALKKLAADHNEEIDEACLKKLAGNAIEIADLLNDKDPSRWLVQFQITVNQTVALSLLIQKIKYKFNGVPVRQDPFTLQELEQIRREHNDLRKLHQDLVTSSTKSIDDLNQQRRQEQDKLTSASAKLTKDLDDARSQIVQLQAEINLLKQDKALPSDAPPPSRCFDNVRPALFEESLRRLLALTDVPAGRSDLNTYIPAQNTADLVLKYVNDNLTYLKGKPEIQDLINNFRITDDDIKAILTVKIEHPYPVYRWLNGHLTGQRGDKVASAIGPYFVLLYRALEKLPKIRAKASRAVLVRDIPALRATFDNYETKCQPQKAMNFWGVSSFSRKDKVGASEFGGTPDEEALIYSCAELEGVDLEPFRPAGMVAEYEILPLCPMVCRIQNVTKVGAKVVIGIRQCEHADYSYVEPKK